jgi:hypothetical protein
MLKSISWGQFLLTVFILVGVYYLVVAVLYYRKDIKGLLKREPGKLEAKEPLKDKAAETSIPAPPVQGSDPDENLPPQFADSKRAIKEIQAVLERARLEEFGRALLLAALHPILLQYRHLKGTAFEIAINNFLEKECKDLNSVHLEADEVKALWQE